MFDWFLVPISSNPGFFLAVGTVGTVLMEALAFIVFYPYWVEDREFKKGLRALIEEARSSQEEKTNWLPPDLARKYEERVGGSDLPNTVVYPSP